MAIVFDSVGTAGAFTAAGTAAHTINSNTNGILLAFFFMNSGTASINANPTFAGTAMTKIIAQQNSFGGVAAEAWYLLNPPTGLGTTLGTANAGNRLDIVSLAYTGVSQVSPIAGSTSGTSSANGTIGSITSVISGSNWFVGASGIHTGPGTLVIGNQRGTVSVANYDIAADSTGGTLEWDFAADNSSMVGAQLAVAAASSTFKPSNLLNMGVG